MNTNQRSEANVAAPEPCAGAVADVKARLQHDYEEAYPQLAEIIHLVLDEEEAKARELSFPHLFLPDLVAAHIEKLNLEPLVTSRGLSSSRQLAVVASEVPERTARPAARFAASHPQLRAA